MDSEDSFALPMCAKMHIQRIGKSNTPIIIIDNFLSDGAEHIRSQALQADFVKDEGNLYPGVRAALPLDYVSQMLSILVPIIRETYQVPITATLKPKRGCYSLITQDEKSLNPLQRIPHFDDTSPYFFAILHYLAEGEHGDTGFFRHQPTGLERVYSENELFYFASANAFFEKNQPPSASYLIRSDEHYTLYDRVSYKANRVAIYPSNILHSTLVNLEKDITSDVLSGRLTANLFINFV